MWIEMKNKENFFYKLSFHNKLLLIFLPLIFAFIIITGGACLSISSEQLKLNTEGLMENSVHQTETMIEDKLNTIHLKAVSIVDSSAFKYFVFLHKRQDPIDKEYLKNRKKLYQQLTDIAVDNAELIDSIVILEKTGKNVVYMRSPSPYVMKDTYDTLLSRLEIEDGNKELFRYIWKNEHEDTLLSTKIPRKVMTLLCVNGDSDSDSGAILAVNFRAGFISDILKNIVTNKGSFAAVLSSDGLSCYEETAGAWKLSDIDKEKILSDKKVGKGSFITKDTTGKDIMLTYEKLFSNNWVIVYGVPLKSIMTRTEAMKKMIFLLVILMLIAACVPVMYLSMWMSKDISGLAEQIEKYEIGAKELLFTTKDQKELKRVAGALNQMVETIQVQVREIIQVEKRKRKAELLMLQSQINPHFLYNTLFSVKTLIDLQRYQMASDMFQSLIDFYVISLNHGKERVTIRKELEVINNYLSILKIRYNESFEWMVNVDEDILDCEILTLTLQPLVENAVQHGIKNKTEKGMIDISGCSLDGTIILTVWDNGEGISPETLEVLENDINEKELQDKKENPHFGLWNSNQRLKLYFGEEYGIQMESEKGKYTSVTVRIPEKKYEG